jgi:hypothetical protein
MSEDDLFVFFQLFAGLNGLLLPGGSAPLVGPGGYAEVGMIFFQLAKEVKSSFFIPPDYFFLLNGDFFGSFVILYSDALWILLCGRML